VRPRACRLPLTVAVGGMAVTAFAPMSWRVLAPLALAVLFANTRSASPKAAFGIGYAFGLGLFGFGVAWVHVAVEIFGGNTVLAWLAAAGLVLVLAVFPGMAMAVAARVSGGRGALHHLAVLPGCWVICEWLRGRLLSGFPWLQFGYSQTATALAGWIAPVAGVLGLSLFVALVAGALAHGLRSGNGGRRWALAAGALWLAAWVLPAPSEPLATQAAGDALAVALVQGDVAQARKWRPQARQAIVARYRRLSAPYWGRADLIVWPETAIPAVYVDGRREPYAALRAQAQASPARLFAGTLRAADVGIRNSVIDLGSGRASDKRHLVPFGEYVPAGALLRPLLAWLGVAVNDLGPGGGAAPLPVAGTAAGAPVCYEMAFAGEVAERAAQAGLLVNVSDDVWFGRTIGLWQNREMARMRALETGRPVLRATNTGLTAVIGADGRLQATLAPFVPGVLAATVVPRTGLTPFVRWASRPVLVVAALIVAIGVIASRTGRRGLR